MREEEISIRTERYKESKPLSKISIIAGYIIVALLLVFTVLTKNHFFLLLFLTSLSAIVNYQTNMTAIRINPQPEVFAGLVITKLLGFGYAAAVLFITTIVIDIYTARLDKDTIISMVLTLIISFIISKVMPIGFVFFAIILITLKFIAGLLINLALEISPQEILFEHVLGFVMNVILFLAFGNFVYSAFTHV
jgi:hypothetical protein